MPKSSRIEKKVAPWNDVNLKWVCEEHPTKEQEHRLSFWKRCGGAGMPEPHEAKGHICTVGCPNYQSGHSINVDGSCNLGCH